MCEIPAGIHETSFFVPEIAGDGVYSYSSLNPRIKQRRISYVTVTEAFADISDQRLKTHTTT